MSNWKNRRVFVTGISGFIGQAIAARLCLEGAYVVGLTRTKCGKPKSVWHNKLYNGDVTNHDLLRSIISYEEIDTIFHLAAYAIVRVSAKDPYTTYNVNVMGTAALLEAARIVGGVERIIVASSDKAYGDHDELPYKETHALQPKNTYDTSKACMDLIAQSYRHNYDMRIVVTRCSNVYGPGDRNISRIVPNTIRRALNGLAPLVYSDVECMEREFIYIDDVVDAYLRISNFADINWLKPAINIGGGGAIKIYDFVKIIADTVGIDKDPIVIQRDPRFKEIKKQYIDASYLESLGWKAKTGPYTGVKKSVEWYRNYLTMTGDIL